MTAKTRWGILSTGRIAHQAVSDFAYVQNGKVAAVASRSTDTARAFAKQYDIEMAYGDYAAMLADPNVDAVYIATPHTLHFQNTLDAINAGKHVLCEKPLTVNPEEAEELARSAQEGEIYVMEAMWTWFLPAIQKAQQWVQEGRIGRLKQLKADFGYPQLPYDARRREYDADLGGGCLLEMGIYPVALARLFLQTAPLDMRVSARFAPNGVEDDVVMIFEYEDCVVTLATSFRCKLQNWAYIIGDEGYIAIPDFWRASECYLYELDTLVDRFDDGRSSLGFNYEFDAVNVDLAVGRKQSRTVPLAASLAFQRDIARIKKRL